MTDQLPRRRRGEALERVMAENPEPESEALLDAIFSLPEVEAEPVTVRDSSEGDGAA